MRNRYLHDRYAKIFTTTWTLGRSRPWLFTFHKSASKNLRKLINIIRELVNFQVIMKLIIRIVLKLLQRLSIPESFFFFVIKV